MTQDVVANAGERTRGLEAAEFWGWQPIAEIELTGIAASVTFTNIPPNYRSLALMVQARTNTEAEIDRLALQFNGDTTNAYDMIYKYYNSATGSTGAVTRQTDSIHIGHCEGAWSRANNWSPTLIFIPGYARADREKWAFSASSGAFGNVSANADMWISDWRGRWRNTDIIVSVLIEPVAEADFVAGTTFELYGVL